MASELLLSRIDDLVRGDHYHLSTDDKCYFLREYTAYAGYSYSETNNLISNLKKSPEKKDLPEYYYKGEAIKQCARELGDALPKKWNLDNWALVPVPPSTTETNPLHDDRIWQIARRVVRACNPTGKGPGLLCGRLLRTINDRDALHASARKRDVAALAANLEVDETLAASCGFKGLIFLDDVITTGATFVACRSVLRRRLPDMRIIGVFVARRVPEP